MNWYAVTRLGEAQILLPAALFAAGWLAWCMGARATARSWLGLLGLAIALTTVSKLAFMGWGIGVASLDFTGFSGHAMFAAAVYPMLARIAAGNASATGQKLAYALGVALALAIAVSRLEVHAHSLSEVVTGSALGLAASGLALRWHPISFTPSRPWMPMILLACLLAMPWKAPPALSHQLVTRLALALSQRPQPSNRADLHHRSASTLGMLRALRQS
jgi:membrane-associated phospholipid phosphatase